jgi:hypothetical protein
MDLYKVFVRWNEFIWLRIRGMAGSHEDDNEPLGSMNS